MANAIGIKLADANYNLIWNNFTAGLTSDATQQVSIVQNLANQAVFLPLILH